MDKIFWKSFRKDSLQLNPFDLKDAYKYADENWEGESMVESLARYICSNMHICTYIFISIPIIHIIQ